MRVRERHGQDAVLRCPHCGERLAVPPAGELGDTHPTERPQAAAGSSGPAQTRTCGLCGWHNAAGDAVCEGCGTELATGAPPPVAGFRPWRVDPRLLWALGALVVLGTLAFGAELLLRVGADRRAVARGRAHLAAGRLAEAERSFREALAYRADNAAAWTGLGQVLLLRGESEQARRAAEQALAHERDRDPAALEILRGRLRMLRGEFAEAARSFERALRATGPRLEPSLLHWLAEALDRAHQDAAALVRYEEALASCADAAEAPHSRLRLALLLLRRGRLERAGELLEQIEPGAVPEADLLAVRGELLQRRGRTAEAADAYTRAAALRPEDPWLSYRAARARLALGQHQAALQALAAALALEPHNAEFLHLRGEALEAAGQPAAAREAYLAALAAEPARALTHLRLGLLAARAGQLSQARHELEAAVELDPTLLEARLQLAEVYRQSGALHLAAAALRVAAQLEPLRPEVHYQLAEVLRAMGEAAQAIAQLEEVVRLDPGSLPARRLLAELYAERGEPEAAASHQRAVVRLAPEDDAARLVLARLLLEADRHEAAIEVLHELLDRTPDNPEAKALLDRAQQQRFLGR
ncbi:MAG: hypothetical protein KatS3mg102_2187 [Planctomycetota bacterium]|nr:MAG: hypothetical protein KatS3mg102_2187 [Planctomycetota bacterium]